MSLTNAALASQITAMVTYWRARDAEFAAWMNGEADGGPYSDGRYPLTDYLGEVQYLYCPAALVSGTTSSAASAAAAQAAAEAAQALAEAAEAAAVVAQGFAETYKDDAEAARDLADSHRANAENYRTQAQAARNLARDWASKTPGEVVADGLYSARHYAESIIGDTAEAAASAAAAAASESAAAGSASAAASSASAASSSASAASSSASSAAASAAAAASEVATAIAALSSVYQPLDGDLTAIAALSTSAFGRGLLELADASALRTAASVYSAAQVDAGFQPLDGDLTSIAALTTTTYGRDFLTLADNAALATKIAALAPTWSGVHTFAAGSVRLWASGGSSDNKNWLQFVNDSGGYFGLATATSAAPGSEVKRALTFERSGTAITAQSYGNSTDYPQHYVYGNFLQSGHANRNVQLISTAAESYVYLYQDGTAGVYLSNYPSSNGGYLYQGNYILRWASTGGVVGSLTYGNNTDYPTHLFYGANAGHTAGSLRVTSNGSAYITSARASQSAGQVGFSLMGGTSGTNWAYYMASGVDDLYWYNDIGGIVMILTTDGTLHLPAYGAGVLMTDVDGQVSAGSVSWSSVTGKPSFATVATSGAYSDLSGTPTLGSIASHNVTISTSDPSGTPADGDIWIKRAA